MLNKLSFVLLWLALGMLASCGGGDSSSTHYSGGNLNSQGQSPAVSLPFTQAANNLPLVVDSGVQNGFGFPVANTLFASVKVCEPGGGSCVTVDHVLVDTGSVGLRIIASKLSALALPALAPVSSSNPNGDPLWECYPFVIGGLWGSNVVADVGLGPLTAITVPIQLIQDNSSAALQAPANCVSNSSGGVMTSASALGANGILGIGSVTLDCGLTCVTGNYGTHATDLKQYYSCPSSAADSSQCTAAAVPANFQTHNPVSALPNGRDINGIQVGPDYSNGIVIRMPAVGGLGAATASGELIFGINSASNNQLGTLQPVYLGTTFSNSLGAPDPSYLGVTTLYNGQTLWGSYLDTGSNALFFNDAPGTQITRCVGNADPSNPGMAWYCPASTLTRTAHLQDGLASPGIGLDVQFSVANAESLFFTSNAAFDNLAATAPLQTDGTATFAWGLPFYFGRQVYQSIWDLSSTTGPWYAWKSI